MAPHYIRAVKLPEIGLEKQIDFKQLHHIQMFQL